MTNARPTNMTATQELAVRRRAASHLSGMPARQNAAAIDLLETNILLEEIQSRHTPEEWASWESQEMSLWLL